MPTLTIEGKGTVEVAPGTRLVNAITAAGVDIGHRCGGFARCTTCRVEFAAGEPARMTRAEKEKRAQVGLGEGVRLSCQILTDRAMTVRPLLLASEQGWPDAGPPPEATITPPAEWVELSSTGGK
jgi:ferredoxin